MENDDSTKDGEFKEVDIEITVMVDPTITA